jgi:hypothetical protein
MDKPSLPPLVTDDKEKKKPRHRHSPAQLAALNDLFDKVEHPSLNERSSLAVRLGMETKTVNAWFQNKRASTKKKNKGPIPESYDTPPIASLISSNTSSIPHSPQEIDELDDFADEDYPENGALGPSPLVAALDDPKRQSLFFAGNAEHRHVFAEAETLPRRMRMRNRPTAEQTNELRKLYRSNAHPSKEERENLGERIGMTLKSITNWFQNQRSQAKKRKEDEASEIVSSRNPKSFHLDVANETKQSVTLPPASNHPSLLASLPPPSSHPSLPVAAKIKDLPNLSVTARAVSSADPSPSPRRSTPRRSSTPYHVASALLRPRRTRPEPYQLEELKKLNERTSNPTIEERSALALEIGMDVGKVTNWFRNLRQTARKRAKRQGVDDDGDRDDDSSTGHNIDSTSVSRAGTPRSSGSSSANDPDDHMDVDVDEEYDGVQSDAGSEDEYQEAVTPSPDASPSPSLSAVDGASTRPYHHHQSRRPRDVIDMVVDPVSYTQLEKGHTATKFTGVKVEDALLLLSFHKHVVR